MRRFAALLFVACFAIPLQAQWETGAGDANGTVRTADRVGISPQYTDAIFPRFQLETGRWSKLPGDIYMGNNAYVTGASIEGDLFVGNITPTASHARTRLSSNSVQGFLQWNIYYNGTGLKSIDPARAGYGLDFRALNLLGQETPNPLQNGVTINRYLPDANGGVTAVSLLSIDKDGNVSASGTINANYQDVAEWVPGEGDLTAGTVVVLDTRKSNAVVPSSKSYDSRVAGVISDRPGLLLGAAGESKSRVATLGRVKVSVDATKRPVQIGDLLVTSDEPGMAMVSEPIEIGGVAIHRPGTLVGKALEPLTSGRGQILVLLSLQ
ncbi:MAG TPA: hypothetical protein VEK79_17290 [Thermoanaerobaculia bacterium]|nr:hypothetical protein [Thermoanaerobaculia bacterium]